MILKRKHGRTSKAGNCKTFRLKHLDSSISKQKSSTLDNEEWKLLKEDDKQYIRSREFGIEKPIKLHTKAIIDYNSKKVEKNLIMSLYLKSNVKHLFLNR